MKGSGGWLVRTGTWVIAIAPIPALFGALELVAIPALGVVAHVAMMITGVLFMCLGFAWPDKYKWLTVVQQRAVVILLVAGAYLGIGAVIVAALLGIGGQALSAIPGGIIGSPAAEAWLTWLLRVAGLFVAAALALVLRGLRAQEADSDHPVDDAHGRTPVGARLVRWGVGFVLLAVLSALLTSAIPWESLGWEWLGMATHVGMAVTGLVLMSLGLVLPEVELVPRVERQVFSLLAAGAIGTVLTGVLAVVTGEGNAVLDVFFTGFIGTWSPVQFVALASVLATAFAVATIWHELPELPPATEGALARPEDMSGRVIRLGVVLILFALVAALLTGLTRVPRVAVGTWATILIIGPMLLCFGLVWQTDVMSEDKQRTAYSFLRLGAVGILVTGMVLALLGIGGDTLGVSAAGYEGNETQELIAKLAVDGAAVVIAIGLILVWRGTRDREERSVVDRWLSIAYYVFFVLILQTAFYHVLPNVYFEDDYPVRLMDYDGGRATAPVVWLGQGWTEEDWNWFYHAPQGGAFELPVPYDWMMALEQPKVRFWPRSQAARLMDETYLVGFGFLPNPETAYAPCEVSVDLGRISRVISREATDPCTGGGGRRGARIENNPDALPVGFTRVENWIDHATGQTIDAMGFTCAACHTGQLDYRKADGSLGRVRIDGGPANVDLGKFRSAVSISLALTKILPGRFDRFADRLDSLRAERLADSLGVSVGSVAFTRVDRESLRADLDALLERGSQLRELQDTLGIYPTTEGYARLDAIGRIANYVFSNDLGRDENLDVANAPVNFPYIWDAPKLAWVQYNASFRQPMMRNAGQSLGVFASVDLEGAGRGTPVEDDALLFSSSIDVLNIHEMETLLGGCTRQPGAAPLRGCRRPGFEGLKSPEWEWRSEEVRDLFGEPDDSLVREGLGLYGDFCAHCHGVWPEPADSLAADTKNWAWDTIAVVLPSGEEDTYATPYVHVEVTDLFEIGTDPLAAVNFRQREATLGELGERLGLTPTDTSTVGGGQALQAMIRLVKDKRYADLDLELPDSVTLRGMRESCVASDTVESRRICSDLARSDTLARVRLELDGYRSDSIQAPLGYRARPLNGVWATPPFLHNGSVPTLYHLLSPQEDRPEVFWLGSRMFDTDSIGFRYDEEPGAFRFDTSLPGNSNQGHSFEGDGADTVGKRGVVGPYLSHRQRMAIIEYLKTLPPLPAGPATR